METELFAQYECDVSIAQYECDVAIMFRKLTQNLELFIWLIFFFKSYIPHIPKL